MIKILYIGDICGKVGRQAVKHILPKLKNIHKPDLVIANVENSAGGYGVTASKVQEITSFGVDLCTGGDHTFSIKQFASELNENQKLPFIRPANYESDNIPGKGYEVIDLGPKGSVAVIQVLGRELFAFNQKVLNPFLFVPKLLENPEIASANLKIIEIQAESTAEKLSFAWSIRDKVQAVVGTHTHVSTADQRLLGDGKGKIAYVTDIGQVGPYNASLWVKFEHAIHNFKYPFRLPHEIEEGKPHIFNSVLIEFSTDSERKYSPKSIQRIDIELE